MQAGRRAGLSAERRLGLSEGQGPGHPLRRRDRRRARTGSLGAIVGGFALVASACSTIGGIGGVLGGTSALDVGVNAASPGGPINGSLLGVDGPGNPGAVAPLATLGLRYDRTDVSFEASYNGQPVYNCSTGAFNPTPLDQRVSMIKAEGSIPELIVDYTPPCLAPLGISGVNLTYEPPDLGANQAKWDALVYQMAYHEITAEGVRVFEIWNEPDGFFWYGGLPGYLHLYGDTATVLENAAKAAGVSIEVGGPGLALADPVWTPAFLAYVAANHLPLDFLSWHSYANDPLVGPGGIIPMPPAGTPPYWYNPALSARSYGAQVALMRKFVSVFPSLHPKLWIDEWNADAGYDIRMSQTYDAAFAAAVLDSVQAAGLNRMDFFNAWNSAGGNPPANWGLLQPNDTPQPVYYTFSYWHQMAGEAQLPVSLPSQVLGRVDGRVGAVASIGTGGVVHVLVYNWLPYSLTGNYGTSDPTPYDHTVKVSLSGLAKGSYNWSQALVDGQSAGGVVAHGSVSGSSASISFDLAGEGVTLLTLTPSA